MNYQNQNEDREDLVLRVAKDYTGQIEVRDLNMALYLYTVKYGKQIIQDLYVVLSKKLHWDKPDILARMIFCRMMPPEEQYLDTGFGISLVSYLNVDVKITLNCELQIVSVYSKGNRAPVWSGTFQKFIDEYTFPEAKLDL